jgi:hypothetical protein
MLKLLKILNNQLIHNDRLTDYNDLSSGGREYEGGIDEKGKYKLIHKWKEYYTKWDSESDMKIKTSYWYEKHYESGEVIKINTHL